MYSDDCGKSWQHASMMMFDEYATGVEAWIVELSDGRLLGTCWHLNQKDGSDFPNAYAISHDGGCSWTKTQSTGIMGQASALAALDDGRAFRVERLFLWRAVCYSNRRGYDFCRFLVYSAFRKRHSLHSAEANGMNDHNVEWKVHMNSFSYKEMLKRARSIVLVCHGNILRSQVLEQYLNYYAKKYSVDIKVYSFGIAGLDAYPNADLLLDEVKSELSHRGIAHYVERKTAGQDSLSIAMNADIILVADSSIKSALIDKTDSSMHGKIFTFYEIIDEGEKSFIDTYDPKTGRQDPQRFAEAFSELDRIALKMINTKGCCDEYEQI